MKKINRKSFIIFILAALLIFVTAFAFACTDKKGDDGVITPPDDTTIDDGPKDIQYSVTVQRKSGHPLSGITVLAKDENGGTAAFLTTGENGKVTFTATEGTYEIQLASLPEGFINGGSYSVTKDNPNAVIELSTSVLTTPASASTRYELGSVMHDFPFTDTQGNQGALAEILKTKKAVLLNFWFIGCSYCVKEFPAMQRAYLPYEEDVEVLAITVQDNTADSEAFRANASGAYDWDELPFRFIANDNKCSADLFGSFGVTGCPTSVMIDREGVVCFTASGEGSEGDFRNLFDKYTAEPYKQTIYFPNEGGTLDIPDVAPPLSSAIEGAINNTESGFDFSYYFEADMYNWPWIIGADGKSIKAANSGHHGSYAIMYVDVTMTEDKCLTFDYRTSCEDDDRLYVFVDKEIYWSFGGVAEENVWSTCFAYVPLKAGEHNIAFAYVKDGGSMDGEDTVYIKNMRFVGLNEVVDRTEMKYACVDGQITDSRYENYVTPVFNETDGYYHVNDVNGPLVLADLTNNNTRWSNDSVFSMIANNNTKTLSEAEYNRFIDYCGFSTASRKTGLVAVTEELKTLLDKVVREKDENYFSFTWLEVCSFYKVYGDEGEMEDPIIGFTTYNAYESVLSEDENNPSYNHVNKDIIKLPRGLWYKFVPTETAIYNARSVGEVDTLVWLADEKGNIYMENDDGENMGSPEEAGNFSINALMQAGKAYYYIVDFNDPVVMDKFDFIIRKLAASGDVWTSAAEGYVADIDDQGNMTGDVYLRGAVDYVLGDDGYYHVLNADKSIGSIIYINLGSATNIFTGQSISSMVNIEGYYCMSCGTKYHKSVADFMEEEEHLCYKCGNAATNRFEKKKAFELPTALRDEDGKIRLVYFPLEDGTVEYVPIYELNYPGEAPADIFEEGKYLEYIETYNGIKFADYTEIINKYVEMSTDPTQYPHEEEILDTGSHEGYVAATPELVEVLQKFILFGDYSFPSIEDAWLLLASYYMHLG